MFDRLTGPAGITARRPTFAAREAYQHIAAWARDRLDADAIGGLVERFLADPRVVYVAAAGRRRRNQPTENFTTVELLETEDNLLGLYRQGRVDHGGAPQAPVDPAAVEDAITAVGAALRVAASNPKAGLSGEQADLVRHVLGSGDLVRLVGGPAGTGKTEAMRALPRRR